MGRVFAVIGFSFLLMSIICISIGANFSLMLSLTFLICFVISLYIDKIRKQTVILVVLLSCFICGIYTSFFIGINLPSEEKFKEREVEITAQLVDYASVTKNSVKYVFKIKENDSGLKNGTKFNLYTSEELDIEPYDYVKGKFELDNSFVNESSDYALNVYTSTYLNSADDVQIIRTNKKPIEFYAIQLRAYCASVIDRQLSVDAASLTKAVLYSDRTSLDDDFYQALKTCGLVHATSASGMHLSVISSAVFAFLMIFGLSRRKSSAIAIVFVIFYCVLVGFYYPILRSGIMMVLYLLSNLIYKKSDAINSMGLSLVLFILINPFSSINAGMLLSLASTFGMVVLLEKAMNLFEKKININSILLKKAVIFLLSVFVTSFAATVFTLPLIWYYFGYISLIAPLCNLFILQIISLNLILAMILIVVGAIPFIGEAVGFLTQLSSDLIYYLTMQFSKIPNALVTIDYEYMGYFIAFSLIVFAVGAFLINCCNYKKFFTLRICSYLCVIALIIVIGTETIGAEDKISLNVLNSGNGVTAVLKQGESAVVIGSGGSYSSKALQDFVITKNVKKIELLVLPSFHKDYVKYSKSFILDYEIDNLLIEKNDYDYYDYLTLEEGLKIHSVDDTNIKIWSDVQIISYNQFENNALLLKINGKKVLFANQKIDVNLLNETAKNVDVLVCSGKLPINYKSLKTEFIIGASNKEVSLSEFSSKVFSTFEQGEIQVEFKDKIRFKRG